MKVTVKKYDKLLEDWEDIGAEGFSTVRVDSPYIAVDGNDELYASFTDEDVSGKATVMHFDGTSGSWQQVGAQGLSGDRASYTSLDFLSDGTPLLSYMDWSQSMKLTVKKAVAAAPIANLTASPGSGQVTLNFDAPAGASDVKVEQSLDGGTNWTGVSTKAPINTDSTSATVIGLQNGVSYMFRLNVTEGMHAGQSNEVTSTPAAPIRGLSAESGNGQITLKFPAAFMATSVSVEISTDMGQNWSLIETSAPLDATSRSATVNGLTNGTAYQFRLNITGGPNAGISNIVQVAPAPVITIELPGESTATLAATPNPIQVQAGHSVATVLTVTYANDVTTREATTVTNDANWISANTAIATVAHGSITGVSAGSTIVTATYGDLLTQIPVLVTVSTSGGLALGVRKRILREQAPRGQRLRRLRPVAQHQRNLIPNRKRISQKAHKMTVLISSRVRSSKRTAVS